jgi:serine/threonine-protein kinase
VPLVATSFEETSPIVSPNGRWLAYASNEAGRKEIYVRPFPNTGDGLWQVSIDGGVEPIWSQNGTELFYRTLAGDVMTAQVVTENEFVVGERRRLFRLALALVNDDNRFWDTREDGQRFLMFLPVGSSAMRARGDAVMIENWFTAVRAAVAEANE